MLAETMEADMLIDDPKELKQKLEENGLSISDEIIQELCKTNALINKDGREIRAVKAKAAKELQDGLAEMRKVAEAMKKALQDSSNILRNVKNGSVNRELVYDQEQKNSEVLQQAREIGI